MTDHNEDKENHLTNLTDLNDFCLLRIFKNLDMQTLLHVAMLDDRLNNLAYTTYIRIDSSISDSEQPLRIGRYYRRVCSAQFLRAFGDKYNKMNICYSVLDADEAKEIESIISTKLKNNLTELTIDHFEYGSKNGSIFKEASSPFVNVEKMCLEYCNLGPYDISKYFPNLRSLELRRSFNWDAIIFRLPRLEHFVIGNLEKSVEQVNQLATILRKNPQLKSLDVECCPFALWDSSLYQRFFFELNTNLPQLECLEIKSLRTDQRQSIGFDNIVCFEKVKVLKLCDELCTDIPIEFPSVEELELHLIRMYMTNWLHFVLRLENLRKLKLSNGWCSAPVNNEIFKLFISSVKSLRHLESVTFEDLPFPIELYVSLVESSETINKLKFDCEAEVDVGGILKKIDGLWKWNIEEKYSSKLIVTMERVQPSLL